MKKAILFSLGCATALSLTSCITSAVLATTAAVASTAATTTAAVAGTATAATSTVGAAAAALPTEAVLDTANAIRKEEALAAEAFRTEAPEGLSGQTLHLNIDPAVLCAAAQAPAGSVSAEYHFSNGNLSDPNGGRTLTYARTDSDTAVVSLSGSPVVVMVIDFTASDGGTLTIRQTAADGSVQMHEGAFYLTR